MGWLKGNDNRLGVHLQDDYPDLPTTDNGWNFAYSIVALPFRAAAAPIRFVIGIVSAKKVDEDIAKRGVLDGEENPDVVEQVLDEYGRRFYRGGRKR